MNDTAAIAQSMARHERILARVRETGSPVAEAPPFAQQLAAANPPVPIAPAAAPDAPVAAASRAMPGLMTAAGEPAAAPPPAETPVVSALPVELSDGQMDVLLRSLGATPANDGAAQPALPAAPAFAPPVTPPAARQAVEAAAEAAMDKSVDRAAELSPEQMALLMQSFGMAAEPAAGDAPAALAASGLPGPPPSADLRFYPVAPRQADENAAAAATASDAYLRTLRTVKGRAGIYGE